jgi:hypothetical protein
LDLFRFSVDFHLHGEPRNSASTKRIQTLTNAPRDCQW